MGDIAEFMFLLSCLLTCVKCAFSWISAFTDKVVAYSVTTIGSHETNEEPNKIDLNVALFIAPSIEFTFCYNCLRSATWFEKSSPSQKCRLLNCSFTCSLTISDVLSYRFVRELQSLSAVPNTSAASLIALQILYMRSPFIQAFCAFHSLTVGLS